MAVNHHHRHHRKHKRKKSAHQIHNEAGKLHKYAAMKRQTRAREKDIFSKYIHFIMHTREEEVSH